MPTQPNNKLNLQLGQTLVIVLLILAVVTTITLSVVNRSLTDINISTKEEEATRAFSAAEAGIEQALIGNSASGELQSSNSKFNIISTPIGGSRFYNYPQGLMSGETASVWFIAHDDSDNFICDASRPCFTGSQIKLCWGTPGTSADSETTPAIQLNVLYDTNADFDYSDTKIARIALDPNDARIAGNSFKKATIGECSVDKVKYAFSSLINFNSDLTIGCSATQKCLLMGRIKFLYNSDAANFGIDTTDDLIKLPGQVRIIESTGVSGEANRKIQVIRTFSDPQSIFDYSLFSGFGTVAK